MASMLWATAEQLVLRLSETGRKIVLAESCTGGLASATLARFPGLSQWYCGSAVTYRNQTKIDWLGVPPDQIEQAGVVSPQVAYAMAWGALTHTAEADVAASITGHLGPDAPCALDGVVYIAAVSRGTGVLQHAERTDLPAWRHQLQTTQRTDRQEEAAMLLLQRALEALDTR